MNIVVSKEDIKMYQKLNIISQKTPILEKVRQFERKYGMDFAAFEDHVNEQDEDFEKWDDYIEWKAYIETLHDLEQKMKDIEDAQDIRITE